MHKTAVVVGGTFAPITKAHIEMGVRARELYPRADIIYIPSNLDFISHWKEVSGEDVFGDRYRLRLVEESVAPYGFLVNTMEARGLTNGSAYESVRHLRKLGYGEVLWCIGTDKLGEVTSWHRAGELFPIVKFLVFSREGTEESDNDVIKDKLAGMAGIEAEFVEQGLGEAFWGISSTKIREAYRIRDFAAVKRMAPPAVYTFLKEKGEGGHMAQEEQLEAAMRVLEQYIHELAAAAGRPREYADELWQRIRMSNGVLRELAYYHDNDAFWDGYEVAGYHLTDILVWQVDHFKAYLDRHEEVKRWRPEELFLSALDIMLQMERAPQPFIDKMRGETGTDYVGKY